MSVWHLASRRLAVLYYRYTDVTQRSQADIHEECRSESRHSQDARTRCVTSADVDMTSTQAVTSTTSRRRESHRHYRSRRRPALLPTPRTTANNYPPWLYPSRPSRQRDDDQSSPPAVYSSRYRPRPFVRQYSDPLMPPSHSVSRHRRSADDRYRLSLDGDRCRREPSWLSEMTPRRQRGSMSLHCSVSIVSRYLHAAGARCYATRVADECERQRRLTDDAHGSSVDDERHNRPRGVDGSDARSTAATTVSDLWRPTSHHLRPSQPMSAKQTDDGGQQTLHESYPVRIASSTVGDSRRGRRNHAGGRSTRSGSGSDSDSTHRPQIRDLRYRPIYRPCVVQNWRGMQYSVRHMSRGPAAERDCEAGRDRQRLRRDSYDNRTSMNSRSVVNRIHKKENLHSRRHSVSSEKSSSSLASSIGSRSRSNSKDHRFKSKQSSPGEHGDITESVKTAGKVSRMMKDAHDAENLCDTTDEQHEITSIGISPDEGDKPDYTLRIKAVRDYNSDDADVKRSSRSHSEPTFNTVRASDVGNETLTNSARTDVRHSENRAMSDSELKSLHSETRCRSKTSTTDDKEVSAVERQDIGEQPRDSFCTTEPDMRDSKYTKADSIRMSPCENKRRRSGSGSRPRSGNNILSAETTRSESSVFGRRDRRAESTSESRKRQKRHGSGRRSRSRSEDRKKRRSSKHDVDHEHRKKSKHDRREKRSHRRRIRTSQGRNSSSASSDDDRCSTAKRSQKQGSPNSGRDQRRLKAERKRLEKVRKKAEKALQKIQQLELNYKEINSHSKKSRSRETSKLSTTKTTTSVSQDKDLIYTRDWNCTEVASDKPGNDKSTTNQMNVIDADFIASYASPVSSPSMSSDAECNPCDDAEPPIQTQLEQPSSENQCDKSERQVDVLDSIECGVVRYDGRGQATAVPLSNAAVYQSFSATATNHQGNDVQQLFDNQFDCEWTLSKTITTSATNKASQTADVLDDNKTAQLDSSGLQISVLITTETNLSLNNEQLTFASAECTEPKNERSDM